MFNTLVIFAGNGSPSSPSASRLVPGVAESPAEGSAGQNPPRSVDPAPVGGTAAGNQAQGLPALSPQARTPRIPTNQRSSGHVESHSSPDNEPRFVGNLDPESTFLAERDKATERYTESDGIGVWVSRRMPSSDASPPGTSSRSQAQTAIPLPLFNSQVIDQFLNIVPPSRHYEGLKAIYLRDIHSLFPVIDLTVLERPEATVGQTLAKQAVCLAAGAHPDAKPFLTLTKESTSPMSYAQFSTTLSSAMRSILSAGLVKDRIQIIPIYVILALYTYGSGDRHLSIEMGSLAVSHVFTIGLHLQIPDSRSENPEYFATLFCCVWAMDQIHSCLHGRPVMMHERDFGRDLKACIRQQESCFRLLLENVLILDLAIELYRPGSIDLPNELIKELPTFESLIEKSGATTVDSRLLATLEVLYHAVVIIACKAPSSPRLSVSSYITAQRSLSSVSITALVEDLGDQLPRFTFVPYAISLSLRVAYRELRASKVPMLRARSYKQLQANCHILGGFSDIFRPALVIVDHVDKLIEEIDKVGPEQPGANAAGQTPRANTPRPSEVQLGSPCPNTAQGVTSQNLEPHDALATPPVLDSSFPEGLARADLFDYLDPEFDLGAIDALLGNPTNPYFPNPFT
ncbi:hypothetical protein jhhlp_002935 [Lomentospora prolificans]|uniref:Xylanolytic transcriptional activator regulatory domain-containing protein n=1 Tax=Lomentospora prolificans TaxID=41688 RepID=A0A2N3NFF8_9PEZI|nr:hypothetical protein jhhlp_002935 [Lomentospora prolificans]